MAKTGLEVIDRNLHDANAWLKDLAAELGTDDRRHAYRVLRAFFHVLRDRLTVDEAADLAAQLPPLLRGIYYEGWKPSRTPETYRDRETFQARLAEEALLAGATEASLAAEGAAKVLRRHVSAGEFDDVLELLPADVRALLVPTA
ncbi:MAG: DUF2267 domain-containing protein [Actinomycetota bacterium]|nr:DUF2267 domain-containing protein [Actinomycetota bacterium]